MDAAGPAVDLFYEQHADLSDLADEVLLVEQADTTRALLQSLIEIVEGAVIAECHGETWPGARGLTVYFPFDSHSGASDLYGNDNLGLDFTRHTSWDELLDAYPYPPLEVSNTASGAPPPPRACYRP